MPEKKKNGITHSMCFPPKVNLMMSCDNKKLDIRYQAVYDFIQSHVSWPKHIPESQTSGCKFQGPSIVSCLFMIHIFHSTLENSK